jgi:hypothetical protein
MSPQKFDALARLIRMRGGAAQAAARLVLVNGLRPADAAREAGVTPQSVCNAVARVQRAEAILEFSE